MEVPVAPSELLTRYIVYRRWFKPSNRFSAFTPYKGETSVFRITKISDDEIYNIGDREVTPKRGKPIHGHADISALNVTETGLRTEPNEPPQRHANIIGWPEEESKQIEIALELASLAQFHKRESTP